MSGTVSNFFNAAAELASTGIESLDATGFSVGTHAAVNTSANIYYFFAFKEVAGKMDVGTYTGDGVDARDITSADDPGLTFRPNFVFVKATTAFNAVGSISEHYGDRSFLFDDITSAANHIQGLRAAGGFQVGTSTSVNTAAAVLHYAAFGGAVTRDPGTGTFSVISGTYTGTGVAQSITGVGFTPDLIIIKDNAAVHSVFRTSLMAGDRTAYLANAVTVFTGGITSIDADGFSLGTNITVNTSTEVYHWTAFGNAMRPDRSGGSSDFLIGQYIGTGDDDTDVDRLPIAPDLVAVKAVSTPAGVWRTSDQVGDNTLLFTATAQAANYIQSLNSDGFQKGTNGVVNASAIIYDFFAFKSGAKFKTGTYTGIGSSQNITGLGFQPEHLWLKKTTGGTAREGVLRTAAQSGDAAQPFTAVTTIANGITALLADGFTVDTAVQTNENTFSYQYVAWDSKVFSQSSYRLFQNTDSTDVGAALAALNTPFTLGSSNQIFRLRQHLRIDNGNVVTDGGSFKLQYVDKGVGTCAVPSGGTPATYTDVTAQTSIGYYDNLIPSNGAALTGNVADPTDGARAIANQSYVESNNFTNNQDLIPSGQNAQWDAALVDNGSATGQIYCFRIVKSDGNVLDTYLQVPEITVPIDNSDPSVVIASTKSPSTGSSPIPISAQFSENVIGFTIGDITVGNGVVGNFVAVNGYTYTFEVTPTTQGVVTVDIAGAVAQDTLGHDNTPAVQFSIIFWGRRIIITS